jgi:hypothetical protein
MLESWKECICNALFNTYAQESRARKRNRSGIEEDIEDPEAHQKHIQKSINLVNKHTFSDCLACRGFRQGEIRPSKRRKVPKGSYLEEISGNEPGTHHGGKGHQTWYGCQVCDVALCKKGIAGTSITI